MERSTTIPLLSLREKANQSFQRPDEKKLLFMKKTFKAIKKKDSSGKNLYVKKISQRCV